MNILIVANYCRDFSKIDNGRFNYLARLLAKEHNVEVITSDFNHTTKTFKEEICGILPFKVTFIHETGYPKNICLRRFYSHYVWGKNIGSYLLKIDKPDLIYCAIPSLEAPFVIARYCKQNNVRFIIDIQDLWPEAFKMVFNTPLLSDIIYQPMKMKADYIYSQADQIIAVSKTYVNRAMKAKKQREKGYAVFLGTELASFDLAKQKYIIKYNHKEIHCAYIGSLGYSYDLECIIDAIALLKKRGITNIRLIVMGDGPLKEKFENHAKSINVNCDFLGKLDYPQMVRNLCACDIAVNPIKKGSAGSILNKVGDYAAAGLPVINTQDSREYRDLLEEYNAGLNCICGEAKDVAMKFEYLIKNENIKVQMGLNSRKLAEEKFDRARTYETIVQIINDDFLEK
ncbi:glycosyltransferase family 4 protein [Anaerovorax odorimutans]|nr:glycosyltransferase family 4 protein [Anaerovorax odorimutans]